MVIVAERRTYYCGQTAMNRIDLSWRFGYRSITQPWITERKGAIALSRNHGSTAPLPHITPLTIVFGLSMTTSEIGQIKMCGVGSSRTKRSSSAWSLASLDLSWCSPSFPHGPARSDKGLYFQIVPSSGNFGKISNVRGGSKDFVLIQVGTDLESLSLSECGCCFWSQTYMLAPMKPNTNDDRLPQRTLSHHAHFATYLC